jgi:hypothetical protein
MARNWPGPWSVEYNYETTFGSITLPHSHEVNCYFDIAPVAGQPIENAELIQRSGGTVPADVGIQQYWQFYRAMLPTVAVCTGFSVWQYAPNSEDKTWVGGGNVDGPTGAAVTAFASHQLKMTFRTALGGIMQMMVMEDAVGGSALTPLIPANTGLPTVVYAAYILSAANWAIARDDSFPVQALRIGAGENEVLFRERNR